jgi:predicted GIY-YIG superfamily endonuclease
MCQCQFCAERLQHPLYCYLIAGGLKNKNKASTYIGVSRQVLYRVKSHNRVPGWRVGSKSTKSMAGKWVLLAVIGPWFTTGAKTFKAEWRAKSRKLHSRLLTGVLQAKLANKSIFVSNKKAILQLLNARQGIV